MAYSNLQVAHNFAHRTGKKQNGSNMFYEMYENGTATIYSYGRHFGIAHVFNADTVIITDETYSNTTARHKSIVWSAVSHYKNPISVPFEIGKYIHNGKIVTHNIAESVKRYESKINRSVGHHKNARKYGYVYFIISDLTKFKTFCEFFDCVDYVDELHKPFVIGEKVLTESDILSHYFTQEELERLERRKEANKERERIRQEEKQRKEKVLFTESLEKFRQGKTDWVQYASFTYLRYNAEHNRIETSKGMKIEIVPQLRTLYNMMTSGKELTEPISIQGFSVNAVTPKFIKIGCHTISKEEADRIAEYL